MSQQQLDMFTQARNIFTEIPPRFCPKHAIAKTLEKVSLHAWKALRQVLKDKHLQNDNELVDGLYGSASLFRSMAYRVDEDMELLEQGANNDPVVGSGGDSAVNEGK